MYRVSGTFSRALMYDGVQPNAFVDPNSGTGSWDYFEIIWTAQSVIECRPYFYTDSEIIVDHIKFEDYLENTTVSLAAQSITVTQQSITVATGTGKIVALAAQAITVTQQNITTEAGNTVSLAAQAITVTQETLTVDTGGPAIVSLAAQSITVSQQTLTTSTGTTVSLAAQAITVAQQTLQELLTDASDITIFKA